MPLESRSTEIRSVNISVADTYIPALTPSTTIISTIVLPPGITDRSSWEHLQNPLAGLRELRWFQDNVEELAAFQGQWIAILGEHIVAQAASLTTLREDLNAGGLANVLVVRVPDNVAQREYFIG